MKTVAFAVIGSVVAAALVGVAYAASRRACPANDVAATNGRCPTGWVVDPSSAGCCMPASPTCTPGVCTSTCPCADSTAVCLGGICCPPGSVGLLSSGKCPAGYELAGSSCCIPIPIPPTGCSPPCPKSCTCESNGTCSCPGCGPTAACNSDCPSGLCPPGEVCHGGTCEPIGCACSPSCPNGTCAQAGFYCDDGNCTKFGGGLALPAPGWPWLQQLSTVQDALDSGAPPQPLWGSGSAGGWASVKRG